MADAPAPRLELIFAANVSVAPPLDCGDVGKGTRRIVPITGGEFSGPDIRGKVLPGGADWQILRGDGVSELEARLIFAPVLSAPPYAPSPSPRSGGAFFTLLIWARAFSTLNGNGCELIRSSV